MAAMVAAMLAWAVPPAGAATYYVDRGNPACSNSGTGAGSPAQPYCTISAAVTARGAAGNTILVNPGTYPEQVTINTSGVSGSPLIVQANGSGVVIDGADDFTSTSKWTTVSGDVWLASTVTWDPRQVFLDGTRADSSTVDPASLPARSFRWISGAGLYVNAGGGNPGAHQALIGRRNYGFSLFGRSWITIDGFTVARTEDRAIYLNGSCTNVTVSRNIVTFATKMGVQILGGSGMLVSANSIHDNFDHGIALINGATACTIEDNDCYNNARPADRLANGIYLFNCPGNTIRRNRTHDNDDTGIHIQSGSNNCIQYLNRAWSNGDHGFDHLGATGTIHVGDVAYGNYKDGFSIEGNATGTQLHDCIAVDNGLATNEFDLWVDAGSAGGFVSDYNIFWNSTTQAPIKYVAFTPYATIAAYSTASGQDAHSIQANPRFVNAAVGDFHLLAGSPAIDNANSGAPNWPAADADNLARFDDAGTTNAGVGPINYGDRGAYEFRSVAPNQAPNGVIGTPAAPVTITAGQSVDFTGSGTDPDSNLPLTYLWDFGGGAANSAVQNPGPVAFNNAGTFTVTFTVTDALGLADPTPDTRVITVNPPATGCTNLVPNASFETDVTGWKGVGATIAQVAGGSVGSFACRVTSPASTSSFYIQDNPRTISNTTAGDGYRFGATVRSDLGRGSARIRVMEYLSGTKVGQLDSPPVTLSTSWQRLELDYFPVLSGSVLYFTVKDNPVAPSEAFDVDDCSLCSLVGGPNQAPNGLIGTPAGPVTITAGQSVNFTGAGTDPDNSLPLTYAWSFDGGAANSTAQNPGNVVFASAGTYTVTFTVTDALGLADPTPDTRVITVNPASTGGCAANQVANPSFETGVSGWKGVGATIAQVAGGSVGSFACRVTGPASTSSFYLQDSPQTILSTTAGAGYRFAAWVRSEPARGSCRIRIMEYLNGTKVGQLDSPAVTLSSSWQRLEVNYTAVQTGSVIYFTVRDNPVAASEAFDVDDCSVCPLAAPTAAVAQETPGAGDDELLAAGLRIKPFVAPNPMVGASVLKFSTRRPGPLHVAVFDLSGRRVRTLVDDAESPAGLHVLPLGDRGENGARLDSGIYFYRIRSADGREQGRFLIMN